MFTPTIQNEHTDLLVKAMLSLDTPEDAYRLFEDLLTVAEMKSISQRLAVAEMLRQGIKYQDIAAETGVATATITRINRALQYGADGYNRVLDKLKAEQ